MMAKDERMTRIPFPEGVSDTTRRFKRTMAEAFPCDAQQAEAVEFDDGFCGYSALWWAAMVTVSVAGAFVIGLTA